MYPFGITLHGYGKAKVIVEEAAKIKALEQMIKFYEKDYLHQWDSLPDKFRKGMMRGIVAFELVMTDLQG